MNGEKDYNDMKNNIDWERWKTITEVSATAIAPAYSATVDLSILTLRSALFLNGGGAVAVLGFMASGVPARHVDVLIALILFTIGALLSVAASGVAYFSQGYFTEAERLFWITRYYDCGKERDSANKLRVEANQIAQRLRMLACLILVASLIVFVVAGVFVYSGSPAPSLCAGLMLVCTPSAGLVQPLA